MEQCGAAGVKEFSFKNGDYSFSILNLGCAVTSIRCPDRNGNIANIVLPFRDGVSNPSKLTNTNAFFGMTVGRFANRIAGASFELDGVGYSFPPNEGNNLLHSGPHGIWSRIWDVRKESDGFTCLLKIKDMEDGFPGDLDIRVRFSMSCDGVFRIHYSATSTRDCPLNVTNHSYFNLAGDSSRDICSHVAKFNSPHVLGVDEGLIPDGSLVDVSGTPFDFRSGKAIGTDIDDPSLSRTGGYDHAFVIDRFGRDCDVHRGFTQFAHIYEPSSGRMMQAFTDLPAFHFYTGNFLNGIEGYGNRCGFCLETEFYPDCVNHSDFPSCILKAGDLFESTTAFHFYTDLSNAGSCVKMCADAASKEA